MNKHAPATMLFTRIIAALPCGLDVAVVDPATGNFVTNAADGAVVVAHTNSEAIPLAGRCPGGQGVFFNDPTSEPRWIAITVTNSEVWANLVPNAEATRTHVAGTTRFYFYTTSVPVEGSVELAPGVTVFGRGTTVPIPGEPFGDAVVAVEHDMPLAELPAEISALLEPFPPAPEAGLAMLFDLAADTPNADLKVRKRLGAMEEAITTPAGERDEAQANLVTEMAAALREMSERRDFAIAEFVVWLMGGAVKIIGPRGDAMALGVDVLWRRVPSRTLLGEIVRRVVEMLNALAPQIATDPDDLDNMRKSIRRFLSHAGTRSIADGLTTYPELAGNLDSFDRPTGAISVADGVVEVGTKVCRPRRAEDYLTWSASVPYRPNALCPVFDAFLDDALGGDKEAAGFLLRFFGYAMLGQPLLKKLLAIIGETDSGKSVCLDTIGRILGRGVEYAHRRILFRLAQGTTEPHVVRLIGSRLVVVSESRRDESLDGCAIKSMTGGADPLIIRGLYSEPVKIRPTWSVVLVTNHLPKLPTDDPALLNRLLFLKFVRSDRPRDPLLQQKLLAEGEGILRRIVDGANEFLRIGLAPPPSVLALRENLIATDADPMGCFLKDCFVFDPASRLSAEVIHTRAVEWFASNGFPVPSTKELGTYLRTLEPRVVPKKSGSMFYQGLRYREDEEEAVAAAV